MSKSTSITVRLPAALKKQIREAMERERRSLTNFVVRALEDRVAKMASFGIRDIQEAVRTLRANNLIQPDGTIHFPIAPASVLGVEIQRDGYIGDRPSLGTALVDQVNWTVHHLHHGLPVCGFSREVPGQWGWGHLWSPNWEDVTCARCLRKKNLYPAEKAARKKLCRHSDPDNSGLCIKCGTVLDPDPLRE